MSRLLLTNAEILDPEETEPMRGSLLLGAGRIVARLDPDEPRPDDARSLDLEGRRVAPGFLDLHFHGELAVAGAAEFPAALNRAAASLVRHGTTGFLATTLSWTRELLGPKISALAEIVAEGPQEDAACALGIHLEGPWLNPRAAGAHPTHAIRPFDPREGADLLARGEGLIRMVTLAPEQEGASRLIKSLEKSNVISSLGHSLADDAQIDAAAGQGMTHATHIFNAMGPMRHRDPGVPGHILADDRFSCDLICDGVHVHPRIVKLAARAKPGALMLISDRIDLPPASSPGQDEEPLARASLREEGGVWRLADGRLAGSTLRLDQAIRNAQSYAAMTLLEAVSACTLRPARLLGIENERGSLRPGARADLAVLDRQGRVVETWIAGRRVSSTP